MKIAAPILWLLSFISCNQPEKQPILSIKNDIINFGKIKSDSVLKVYFDYQNTGSDTLKILNVSADCGCTLINYEKENIAPGEVGEVEIIYIPKSNKDSGIVVKNIALRSNCLQPLRVIKIKGEVIN